MRHAPIITLATLAVAATAGCSETGSQPPTAVETEAVIASASAWMPSDLTRDLQVDNATRQKIEAGVQALHAAMLAVHERYEKAETLKGNARVTYMDDLNADIQSVHEQHRALWDSLDPEVRETLAARLHERMRNHDDDGALKSSHERMRRMHGGDHGADGTTH
jgi:hypothetical protein